MRSLLLAVLFLSFGAFASEIKHDFLYKWNGQAVTIYIKNAGSEDAVRCRWVYKDGETYRAQLLNPTGDFWSAPVLAVSRIEGTVLAGEPERETSCKMVLHCRDGTCGYVIKDSKKTK